MIPSSTTQVMMKTQMLLLSRKRRAAELEDVEHYWKKLFQGGRESSTWVFGLMRD